MPPRFTPIVAAVACVVGSAGADPKPAGKVAPKVDPQRAHEWTVKRVANMTDNEYANRIANAYGLSLLNVLWEDTGRWEGSSVGPNISDVTIEVEGYRNGKAHRTYLMPVLRHDNFTDKTADVKLDKILIPVGNHAKNGQLGTVTLGELLQHPDRYLSAPDKGRIKGGSLFAKRDTHALVSAQHAFLPVPKEGKATFWPVIFNYQSTKKNPAVLTILVTRQGTSMTIIDNARDAVTGNAQRLYFNHGGLKAPLIAERLADVKASGTTANGENAQDLSSDANVLMLIQVPLKYREPPRRNFAPQSIATDKAPAKMGAGAGAEESRRSRGGSDIDVAVLGHGPVEGPYTELDGLAIERDARFPVRVTLQFYQATSNGVISNADMKSMLAQIRKVYGKGDYVGSLVVPSGLDRARPTNWTGVSAAPVVTWRDFPGLVERYAQVMFTQIAKK